MENELLKKIKEIVQQEMDKAKDAAHDFEHVLRVYSLAQRLADASDEDIDRELLGMAVLLHDIGKAAEIMDKSGQTQHEIVGAEMARSILADMKVAEKRIRHVQDAIISHRYKNDNQPATIEAKILFDADKIDSVGAIGIARGFTWVGKHNAFIYRKVDDIQAYFDDNMEGRPNGKIQNKSQHSPQIEFKAKYIHLPKMMFTEAGRQACAERVEYARRFLDRLEQEIKGEI